MPKLDIADLLTGPPPKPDWLIPNLLVKGGLILLAGPEGIGKSAVGYNLSIALATGTSVFNRAVQPTPVLIFDEENSQLDIRTYLYRAWVGLGRPSLELLSANLHVHHGTLTGSQDWALTLYHECSTLRPKLVILDTVTPACHIVEENSNGEANIAARKIRLAREAAGPECSVLLYKHLKISTEGSVDIRGAKLWKGTVDAILYHRRTRGKPDCNGLYKTYITPEKVRAFGLKSRLVINPSFTENNTGLVLLGADEPLDANQND